MKKYSSEKIIATYENSCKIMKECTLSGNYKKNNVEGKRMMSIFKFLETNNKEAEDILPLFFNHKNVVLRTEAAAHCLSLNIFVEQAEEILEEISKDEKNGIFGFNAKMTLKVWKEQGYLTMYVGQIPRKTYE